MHAKNRNPCSRAIIPPRLQNPTGRITPRKPRIRRATPDIICSPQNRLRRLLRIKVSTANCWLFWVAQSCYSGPARTICGMSIPPVLPGTLSIPHLLHRLRGRRKKSWLQKSLQQEQPQQVPSIVFETQNLLLPRCPLKTPSQRCNRTKPARYASSGKEQNSLIRCSWMPISLIVVAS